MPYDRTSPDFTPPPEGSKLNAQIHITWPDGKPQVIPSPAHYIDEELRMLVVFRRNLPALCIPFEQIRMWSVEAVTGDGD
jgi:hypothetical protein